MQWRERTDTKHNSPFDPHLGLTERLGEATSFGRRPAVASSSVPEMGTDLQPPVNAYKSALWALPTMSLESTSPAPHAEPGQHRGSFLNRPVDPVHEAATMHLSRGFAGAQSAQAATTAGLHLNRPYEPAYQAHTSLGGIGDTAQWAGSHAAPEASLRAMIGPPHRTVGQALDSIEDSPTVTTRNLLHPWDWPSFRNIDNTVNKKTKFNAYQRSIDAVSQAERALADAHTPKERAAAQARLAQEQQSLATTKQALASLMLSWLVRRDPDLRALNSQEATAKSQHNAAELEAIAAARAQVIEALTQEVANEAEGMGPVATPVTTHHYHFPDGEDVKLADNVVSYATVTGSGVDTDVVETRAEKSAARKQVSQQMQDAELGASNTRILSAISGFEGGFSTVNTYDRALVTWGFMQWTGGNASDLTQTMGIIKNRHPEAFAEQLQQYGIDVVGNKLAILGRDGKPMQRGGKPVNGDQAAEVIRDDPKLAAVMEHAGRNPDIQRGQMEAAVQIEITSALTKSVTLQQGKHSVSLPIGSALSSEYAVGLLANTWVHSGCAAAQGAVQKALQAFVKSHPYEPDRAGFDAQAWAAQAEAAIVPRLAAMDKDRAQELKGKLDKTAGSYQE